MADNKKHVEEEIKPGTVVQATLVPLEPAVTEDAILFSVEKIYVQIEFQLGTSNHRAGFTLLPPDGKQILVASARMPVIAVPDNAISFDEFKDQMRKIADSTTAYQERIKDNQNKTSF